MMRNVASPYVIAMLSYALFLVAFLCPSDWYTGLMNEPDLIFFDFETFIFYTICVLAFFAGFLCFSLLRPNTHAAHPGTLSVKSPLQFLCLPLSLSTACVMVYMVLLGSKLNFIGLLLASQGAVLKAADNSLGFWDHVLGFHIAIVLWSYRRSRTLMLQGTERYIFSVLLSMSVAVAVACTLARVDRTDLMMLIFGFYVIRLHGRAETGELTFRKMLTSTATIFVAVGTLFCGFSFLRGSREINQMLASLVGYSLLSYNHMAAVVHGTLVYPYAGRGFYLFPAFSYNPALSAVFHIGDTLPTPTRVEVFQSEFAGTFASGLDRYYIWSGAFGYIFSDAGWLSPLYVFLMGLTYGWAWRSFTRDSAMGLLVYPWLAACQFLWIAYNWVFEAQILVVFVLGIFFQVYENRFGHREESADAGVGQRKANYTGITSNFGIRHTQL